MGSRLDLHSELLSFTPNVYFQPPSNHKMLYPCIVYIRIQKKSLFGNNEIYSSTQGYQIMVMENNPDSDLADRIESHFSSCVISQYYTVDNLNHTTLTLYY